MVDSGISSGASQTFSLPSRPSHIRSVTEEDGATRAVLLDSEVWVVPENESVNVFVDSGGKVFRHTFSPERLSCWLGMLERNAVMVVARKDEDVSWLKECPIPFIVLEKLGETWGTAPVAPPNTEILNKGYEASSYLAFIIDNYECLPEWTLFCHAHNLSYHEPRPKCENIASLTFSRPYSTINLPTLYQTISPKKNSQEYAYVQMAWPHLFSEPVPPKMSFYACAQFYVSKEKIMSRPKSFYQNCLSWLYATEMKDHNTSRVFEYIWCYIFTGQAIEEIP